SPLVFSLNPPSPPLTHARTREIKKKRENKEAMAPSVTAETEVGVANLPNQRHKIVTQKGANFTVMVAGESGLGKTTFINTLLTLPIKAHRNADERHAKQLSKTIEIEVTRAELEERMFSVRLAIVDTPGFGDYVDNRNNWVPIVEYIDNQYENYFRQERMPRRHNIEDNRVHAVLYFIRPTGHTLKPLDVEAMKHLSKRVNLVPVIGKADSLSPRDLEAFKKRVRKVIDANG
ncbi:MAG: putative septin, partial [Olpidium bornovanus]